MAEGFKETFSIVAGDYAAAGEASARIKALLKMIGIDPAVIRRVTVAAYEAEMNIIIHSHGGQMTFSMSPEAVSLHCIDTGPGIEDIDQAMQEGFSTAPDYIREMGFGAGMGLPNMARCADDFSIQSTVGVGTKIRMVFTH